MKTWTRFLIAVLLGMLAACGGGDDSDPDIGLGHSGAYELLGQPAPDFTLESSKGGYVRLADQRGKVVMLNFWASWCGPCRMEMPLIDSMYKRYDPAGFILYGVNVEEDNTDAKRLLQDLGVTFPALFDTQNQASTLYKIDAIPTTVMIDRNGNIRFVNRSYKAGDENKYRDQIRELIRE